MFQLQIPQNQKFKKFNRSTLFRNKKLIRLCVNSTFFLNFYYVFFLISLSKSILKFSQIKSIFQIASKYTKFKRQLRRKKIKLINKSLFGTKIVSENIRSFFLKKVKLSVNFISFLKRKKRKSRSFKKKRVLLCVFPRFPVTEKPLGIRMGKGKGAVSFWQVPVKYGQIILKIRKDVHPEKALFGLIQAQKRIPFKTKIVCFNPNFFNYFIKN